MTNFMKLGINADIDEMISYLKQMQGTILDNDIEGTAHFLDRVRECLDQIEDGVAEAEMA